MTELDAVVRPDPYVSDGTSPPVEFRPAFSGLRCRACGAPAATGPAFVCATCLGPLEPVYDLDGLRRRLSRQVIERRSPSIWRFAELLPVEAPPPAGVGVGYSPLLEAPRLAERLGIRRLWVKDDSRNPTLSFKDRVVAVAAARAVEFGFHTLVCASTGNLSASVAAAAATLRMRAVVFVPADLEPAKVAQAQALGATVVRVAGTYDEVNRLCLELTDELPGWAVVNVNLRPYYSEGSKTLAFEIAHQLGWRLPDVIVAPLASGSLYSKLGRGFAELSSVGLVESSAARFVGGQAAGCGPIATAFADGADEWRPVQRPQTIVRSLAIGTPADGVFALQLARRSRGAIYGVPDALTVDSIRLLAESEGILTETAGGVTLGALRNAIDAGVVGSRDEVVLVITGNGLKTLDAIVGDEPLPKPIAPSFDAFEEWWAARPTQAAAA
jgi:threonine synthase